MTWRRTTASRSSTYGAGLAVAALAVSVLALLALPAGPAQALATGERPFTTRYHATGYGDLEQTGNTLLNAPDAAGVTRWVDVDGDPATVNSSSASLVIPPRARLAWAGLYWGGLLDCSPGSSATSGPSATSGSGSPTPSGTDASPTPSPVTSGTASPTPSPDPSSSGPPASPTPTAPAGSATSSPGPTPTTTPTTWPVPPPDRSQVKIKFADGDYQRVRSATLDVIPGLAFQGYADITTLLRPYQERTALTPVTVTVADAALPEGIGCAGGWSIALAYAYQAPQSTYAPARRHLVVLDGLRQLAAGTPRTVVAQHDPVATGLPATARIGAVIFGGSTSVSGSPPAGPRDTVAVNGKPVTETAAGFCDSTSRDAGGTTGTSAATAALSGVGPIDPPTCTAPGYGMAALAVPETAMASLATSTRISIGTSDTGAFLAGPLTLSVRALAPVSLDVATGVSPATAQVGGKITITVTVRNTGTAPAPGVVVTDQVPAGLSLLETPDHYDAASGTWQVGMVDAGGAETLQLRARADIAGNLVNTAEITACAAPYADSSSDGSGHSTGGIASAAFAIDQPASPVQPGESPLPNALPGGRGQVSVHLATLIGLAMFAFGALALLVLAIRRYNAAGRG